jgi:hypothetical protein
MRAATGLALLVIVALGAAGCSDSQTAQGGGVAKAPDNPRETLVRLAGYVADNNGKNACALMFESVRDTFASDNDALTCEKAVDGIFAKMTDAKAYRAMVPSGLRIDGETASVSGYCRNGWTNADGSYDTLKVSPNNLGDIRLKKTDNGWLISEYRGSKHYSSCGG